MIEALASIGVNHISLGVESGSPRILKLIKKDINPERVIEALSLTNKYKIDTLSYYMIGHPTEDIADIEMSKRLFVDSKPPEAVLSIVCPYPGTELARTAEEKGFKPAIKDYYKIFHQGYPPVNMTNLSNAQLVEEYKKFDRLIDLTCFKRRVLRLVKTVLGLRRGYFVGK